MVRKEGALHREEPVQKGNRDEQGGREEIDKDILPHIDDHSRDGRSDDFSL